MSQTIVNKKQLRQAAEKLAGETTSEISQREFEKRIHTAFEAFVIAEEHFTEFSQLCQTCRSGYDSAAQSPLKPAQPAQPTQNP